MKKITVMIVLSAFAAGLVSCGGQVKHSPFQSKKWIDNDTYETSAVGFSLGGYVDEDIRRSVARKTAVLLAQTDIRNKFKSDKSGAYSSTGEFYTIVKNGRIINEFFDADDNCEIVYQIKGEGLKKKLTVDVVE